MTKIKPIYFRFISTHRYINCTFQWKRKQKETRWRDGFVWSLHDARPVCQAFNGLHLLRHGQDFMKPGAESRHVLEVRLLLHLHRQIVHPAVFQNGRHLRSRGEKKEITRTNQNERCHSGFVPTLDSRCDDVMESVGTDLLDDPLLHHVGHDLEVDGAADHVGRMPPEMSVSVRQNSFDLLNLKWLIYKNIIF